MEFQIPQFIEREPKIIGPLTFKQFVTFAILGGICFVLYFSLPRTVFYTVALLIFGVTAALMFIKKEGFPLYVVIKRSFLFLFSPKLYLWRAKEITSPIIKEDAPKKSLPKEEKTSLKITEKGKLNNIFIQIETGKK